MASYGHQHLLAMKHLRIKGCLTHLLQPIQGPPRHWHPMEVFFLHLGLGGLFIDPDWELAYRFLGNQISTVHALAALVPVFNLLPFGPAELALDEVLQNAIDRRLTVSNTRQIPVANGVMLIHHDLPCDQFNSEVDMAVQEMIQHGIQPFPDDRFWDLTGFHPLYDLSNPALIASPVSMPSDPEWETSFISPTLAFVPVLPVKLKCLDGDHQCWTYADVTTSDLIGLWEGAFELTESDHGEFILTPSPGGANVGCQSALVTMRDGRITISACQDSKIFLGKLGFDGDIVFDQFGILVDGASVFSAVFLSTVPLQPGSFQLCLEQVILAIHQCQIAVSYLPETDMIAIDLKGESQAINLIKSILVHSFASQTLKMLGRVCHASASLITFGACASIDTAPPAAFRIAGVVCLVRIMMDNLKIESGKIVTFKWLNRVLWEGPLPAQLSLEHVRKLFAFAFVWIQHNEQVSFVHRGQNIWNFNVSDLDDSGSKGCKITVVRSMHGGGAKTHQKVQIRNSLAGTLLQGGVDLQWITMHLDKLLDTLGVHKLIPIASLPAGHNRVRQIRDIFAEAGFPIPQPSQKAVQAPKTLQAKARKQFPADPSPADVVMDCSYLLNEDDSHPKQIHEFRGQRSGVFLTTIAEATPWLKEGQPLSADELGMIVMGDSNPNTALPHQAVLLPCADCKGNQFLLTATLIQFGSKKIRIKPLEDQKIAGGECKVAAVTLWQQDWSKEEWLAAISQSAQFIREAFSIDLPDVIVSCWGRSLRKGRQVATNSEATSIQLHCSVVSEQFNSFLAKSGFNRVWTTPKNQEGRISEEFRVLWVPGDLQHVTARATGLSGCAGLVRGKSSLGLRFSVASFDAAWKHLHPSEQVPDHIPATHVFKVEPLPFGCSPQQLEGWAKSVHWKCRPLRATGPKAWLVCAAEQPPQTTLAFNGSPLLVRLLPPRNSPTVRTIVAGPRQVAKASDENASVAPKVSIPHFDPWAQWKGPRLSSQAPVPLPKASQGPTDQKIQQQDDRIAALECQLQSIQEGQSQQQNQIDQIGKNVEQSEERLAKHVHKAVDDAKHDITKSLQITLHQQQTQFEQSMKDIRQLLTAAAKRKTPEAQADDMES